MEQCRSNKFQKVKFLTLGHFWRRLGSYGADALWVGRTVVDGHWRMVEHDIACRDITAHMGKDVRRALCGSRESDARSSIFSFQILLLAEWFHQGLPHTQTDVLLLSIHRAVGASVPLVLGVQLLRLVGCLQVRHLCPLAPRVRRPLGFGHHLQGVGALDLDGGEGHVYAGADNAGVLEEELDDLCRCRPLGRRVREASAEQQSPGSNTDKRSDKNVLMHIN